MGDYKTHLFPYLSPDRIRTLSCGHVIPRENLLAWSVCTGPSGRELKFTFDKRNDVEMVRYSYVPGTCVTVSLMSI